MFLLQEMKGSGNMKEVCLPDWVLVVNLLMFHIEI